MSKESAGFPPYKNSTKDLVWTGYFTVSDFERDF